MFGRRVDADLIADYPDQFSLNLDARWRQRLASHGELIAATTHLSKPRHLRLALGSALA